MAQQRAGEGTYEPPVAEVSGGGSAYGSVAADFATPSASGHPGSGSGGGGGGQAAGYATLPAAYVPSAVHAQQQAAQQYNNAASQQQQFQPVYSNGQPYGQPAPTFGAAVYEAEAGGGDGNAHNPQQKMEINVGHISGIPVRVHVLLPIITALWTLFALGTSTMAGWLTFLVFGPVLYGTVLVHELGHCLAARKVGATVDGILLWPLGGLAYVAHDGDPSSDLQIALAGPLTHGPQAVAWAILYGFSMAVSSPACLYVCASALWMQLSLFVFNLCPAYPLDGGRVTVDLLRLRGVPLDRGAAVCAALSLLSGLGIFIFGCIEGPFTALLVGGWIASDGLRVASMLRGGDVRAHPMFEGYERGMPERLG